MKNLLILTTVFLGTTFGLADKTSAPEKSNRSVKRTGYAAGPVGSIYITIDKSDYELSVYDEKGWYATYPVVFGNNNLDDKKMEGDNNTPEGDFKIISKRVHEKWCRYLGLDYPTPGDYQKFKSRKEKGQIPANAKIGGSIGIHGVWPHEDFVIDRFKNWTMGCISMKNEEVKELYGFTLPGTKVTIRK